MATDTENPAARSAVIYAYMGKINELCEELDGIKDRYGLSDSEMISLVRNWVNWDVADEYEGWIEESD